MPRSLHLSGPSDDDDEALYTVTVDRPTGPWLFGLIARGDSVSVIHWPDGEEAVTMGTLYLPAEDTSDVDAAYARALEALPETVELVFVQHDDGLTDEQIQKQLNGEAPWDDADADEWQSEAAYYGAVAAIDEYVDPDDLEILKSDTSSPIGKLDELRLEVQERDTSDAFADLLRHTDNKCFRYYVGVDSSVTWQSSEEEIGENIDAIAKALGISGVDHEDMLRSWLAEGQDGPVYVYWYGDVEQLVKAANNYDGSVEGTVKPQTITWTNPSLLVLNGLQGSGMDCDYPGTITLPFDRERLKLDAKGIGNGYSWDDVAGIVRSAYACDVTITENTNDAPEA